MSLGSSLAKFGLSSRSDLQVAFTPLTRLLMEQREGRTSVSGVGDVLLRYKHRVTSDRGHAQIAVVPFVKLPTARAALGNGKVEAGMAVPISVAAGALTVTFGPEVGLLADADGSGHHPAIVNLVNVAAPVADRLVLIGELWSNLNFDPGGTLEQASADAALAFVITPALQLDVGANLGLTRHTPDVEVSAGASIRF